MRHLVIAALVMAGIGSGSLASGHVAPAARLGNPADLLRSPAVGVGRGSTVCASPAKMPRDDQPAFSPDGRRLVFVRSLGPDGDSRLTLARADGTAAHEVAGGGQPDWSPDGRSIAFVSGGGQLRVIDLATGKTRTLARSAFSPAWSPDGAKIAFSDGGVATVNADGSDPRQVPVEGVDEYQFWTLGDIDWSPDGKQFVVSVELEPNASTELYTLPVAGGRLHQLTHDGLAINPNWSPDGRWIAYASDGAIYSSLGESIVKLIRADGSGQHRLPPPETAFGWRTREPAWKDASTVVYSAWRPYSSYTRNIELHAIRVDGTGERRLTYHCQYGSPGADLWLTGTYLDDVIHPGGGNDRVRTGRGRDVVYARGGGRDSIDCGPGTDTVLADRGDRTSGDCERVGRQ